MWMWSRIKNVGREHYAYVWVNAGLHHESKPHRASSRLPVTKKLNDTGVGKPVNWNGRVDTAIPILLSGKGERGWGTNLVPFVRWSHGFVTSVCFYTRDG